MVLYNILKLILYNINIINMDSDLHTKKTNNIINNIPQLDTFLNQADKDFESLYSIMNKLRNQQTDTPENKTEKETKKK